MPKQRLIRDEGLLAEDVPLVRGLTDLDPPSRDFDRATLIQDVEFNLEAYGYYGLSLWRASGAWSMDRVLDEKLYRARRVAVFRAGGLHDAGLGLVPSGTDPHYDAAFGDVYGTSYGDSASSSGSAAELVERFLAAAYSVVDNKYYQEPC